MILKERKWGVPVNLEQLNKCLKRVIDKGYVAVINIKYANMLAEEKFFLIINQFIKNNEYFIYLKVRIIEFESGIKELNRNWNNEYFTYLKVWINILCFGIN